MSRVNMKKLRVFVCLLGWPLVLSVAGCDCDAGRGNTWDGGTDAGLVNPCNGTDGTAIECDPTMGSCCVLGTGAPTCVPIVGEGQCNRPYDCSDIEPPTSASECRYTAPLLRGYVATHLDLATASDGRVMLSGYAPGIPNSSRYGDLLVGAVQDGEIRWTFVDGVPTDATITPEPSGLTARASGWRGGINTAGDNVGEFNAIAFSPDGTAVSISYYDRTNRALKFATSTDSGATWSTHTAFAGGDSGRYSSLAYLADGRPAIAFLSMTPATLLGEKPLSRPRVIIATDTSPTTAADWVLVPMEGDTADSGTPSPCTATLCTEGLICRADDGTCGVASTNPSVDCTHEDEDGVTQPGCSASTCVRSTAPGFACVVTRDADYVEDVPEADGLFLSLRATSTGLALVWHNRVRRTLMGNAYDSTTGAWRAQGPFAIDGFDHAGVGDAGYSADLFIDPAGNWHVAYVEGAFEELRHAQVDATTLGNADPAVARELVDDGARPLRDRAIVGTDADIVVLASGEIRIVYQNSTHGEALVATRAAGAVSWALQGGELGAPLHAEGLTGYWTCQALVGDTSHVATWWIDTMNLATRANDVRLFTIP